jgi:SAM-dependent methyltransferase
VTGEHEVKKSFKNMGMKYQVSKTLGNIYLSPRPSMELLRKFYNESSARKFWLTTLWPQTAEFRNEKIIKPQLEWVQGFMAQHSTRKKLNIGEFLPNNWSFCLAAKEVFSNANYNLIDTLFDPADAEECITDLMVFEKSENDSMDTILLFEALDRSPDPVGLLENVKKSLKPGGLCFVTCLLSSGFEVQILGEVSDIFIPPERMNLFSFEGMKALIEKVGDLEVLEFSTPGVLDIPNVKKYLEHETDANFFQYVFNIRQNYELISSFQEFLQMNRLGTFGRLVLRKNNTIEEG